jgi:hypothetical protein
MRKRKAPFIDGPCQGKVYRELWDGVEFVVVCCPSGYPDAEPLDGPFWRLRYQVVETSTGPVLYLVPYKPNTVQVTH